MSSRGLASLLAIPPALRPALLQALTPATTIPAGGTVAQCRWKHTTPRSPLKKKLALAKKKKAASSPAYAKKAGPHAPAKKRSAAPSGPPKGKGKNPNGYPPASKKGARATPPTGGPTGSKGKNPRETRSPDARRKNPNGLHKTSARAPHAASNDRNAGGYASRDDYSRADPPARPKKTSVSAPKAKASRTSLLPMPSATASPPSVEQAFSSEAIEKTMPPDVPDETYESLEYSRPPTALSFLPPPPTEPLAATPAPPPSQLDFTRIDSIFWNPKFLYSAPRFLNVPINTRIPEICILGRSNAGKSTLINALGGISSKKAGRAHLTSHHKLAITSATAGCTKTMNAYGFGPPASIKPLRRKELEARKAGGLTRGAKRAGKSKIPREEMPKHSLVLMDMPGYGMNSRADWGAEILKYLGNRKILSGAVLLIDAVAGVKPGDRSVLEVLRDAGLTTSVVLTKADKLVRGSDPDAWRGSAHIRSACEHVWEEIRRVEKAGEVSSWWEGDGWTPEIFVTGAGDPRMGGMGVDGARVAIARLAGLLAQPVAAPVGEIAKAPVIVPYDRIMFSLSSSMPKFQVDQTAEHEAIRALKAAKVTGRGRTTTRARLLKTVAKPPVDGLEMMEAAIHREPTTKNGKRQQGTASF